MPMRCRWPADARAVGLGLRLESLLVSLDCAECVRACGRTHTEPAHGSFRAISGGWIAEALWDLTGFPTESISFTDRFFDSEMTWARLLSFRRQVYHAPTTTGRAVIRDGQETA
jgi:hypothetical protein